MDKILLLQKNTSAAVSLLFGLCFTKPSTTAISVTVVHVGNMFSHVSPLLCEKL